MNGLDAPEVPGLHRQREPVQRRPRSGDGPEATGICTPSRPTSPHRLRGRHHVLLHPVRAHRRRPARHHPGLGHDDWHPVHGDRQRAGLRGQVAAHQRHGVTVDPLTATAVDGLCATGYGVSYAYGLLVDWFPTGATGYSLQWAVDVARPSGGRHPGRHGDLLRPGHGLRGRPRVGYTVCEYTFPELPATTDYLVRVVRASAPTTWQRDRGSGLNPRRRSG